MRKFANNLFLACGLLLTLAAFPVFAQEDAQNQLNKRPFEDFANSVSEKVQKKEIDFNAPFSVELKTVLTKEGRFDGKKSRFAKSTGDAQMIEIVKSSFEAIGDSRVLKYLSDLGIENLLITATQDDKMLTVQFISELSTESRAKTINSGLSLTIAAGKQLSKSEDEKTLLNAASTTTDGKKFMLNFAVTKEIYQEIVSRKLKEVEAKQQKQSAGNN